MDVKTTIHIGYHKTGTSFLQRKIFERYTDIFHRVDQTEIRKYFILPSPLHYNAKSVESFIKVEFSKATNKKYLVFSNEYLSSNIHFGDHHSKYVAERLKNNFPNSKIIIGIREQTSMIYSAYNQYIKARGSYGIDDYLIDPLSNEFKFDHLKYNLLIKYYIDLFGLENVLVLPYELLKNNPKGYIEKVFSFLEIEKNQFDIDFEIAKKVNPSLNPTELFIKKYFNPFLLKHFLNTGKTFYFPLLKYAYSLIIRIIRVLPVSSLDKKIENKIRNKINNVTSTSGISIYSESNKITSLLTGINLHQLGYK